MLVTREASCVYEEKEEEARSGRGQGQVQCKKGHLPQMTMFAFYPVGATWLQFRSMPGMWASRLT